MPVGEKTGETFVLTDNFFFKPKHHLDNTPLGKKNQPLKLKIVKEKILFFSLLALIFFIQ